MINLIISTYHAQEDAHFLVPSSKNTAAGGRCPELVEEAATTVLVFTFGGRWLRLVTIPPYFHYAASVSILLGSLLRTSFFISTLLVALSISIPTSLPSTS